MERVFEIKEYILKFYAKYSRYVDIVLKFILALLTFTFVSEHVGFLETLANPAVTVGISIICTFLPITMTAVFAALIVLIQFFVLAPGAAIVAGLILLVMFALYFRFASGRAVVLLVTPIAFMLQIPVLVPVVFGLIGGPVCAVPVAFGTIVYYMIAYVKSYATVIETVAESGIMGQITTFTQQLLANKEMWMTIISFTICLLFVYNIRRLAVEMAWEIAVSAGVLVNIIMITFGHVMLDINVMYGGLIIGSLVTVVLALILKIFVFSVDYARTEHLQFEDDEYFYYVKAVPKVSVAVPEKTVKKINVRQETSVIELDAVEKALNDVARGISEEKRAKTDLEESEIQKIIEEELKN